MRQAYHVPGKIGTRYIIRRKSEIRPPFSVIPGDKEVILWLAAKVDRKDDAPK